MQTLDNHQTPGVQLSAVDTYASYLKSVYTREKLPIYDKWPQVKSKKYINLALIEMDDITKPEAYQFMRDTIHGNIDDIKQSKRATDIGQIAQLSDGSQPKCILVEGCTRHRKIYLCLETATSGGSKSCSSSSSWLFF